jgi:hypothetical protein
MKARNFRCQHLCGVTSEKADGEQRQAKQNNDRKRRSATQRATRSPEQSNTSPRAEAIRRAKPDNSAHRAAGTTTLAERPHNQSLRRPAGAHPTRT